MMDYSAPRSLEDIVIDGLLAQAIVDRHFRQFTGPVGDVEFNGERTADAHVDIRFHRVDPGVAPSAPARKKSTGLSVDASGFKVAEFSDSHWQWTTTQLDRFSSWAIPQLHNQPQEVNPLLFAATRTLCGNRPIVIRAGDGTRPHEVIVVNYARSLAQNPAHSATVRDAVIAFLSKTPGRGTSSIPQVPQSLRTRNEKRAVLAFAAHQRQSVEWNAAASAYQFDDGSLVQFRGNRIQSLSTSGGQQLLSLPDIQADAFFLAAEHEMLVDALLPRAQINLNLHAGTFTASSGPKAVSGGALLIATCTPQTWTWAWADPFVASLRISNGSHQVRHIGQAHGIVPLLRPHLPAEEADAAALYDVVKPILNHWVHLVAPLGTKNGKPVTGLFLARSPQLQLAPSGSPLARQAQEAVLDIPVPPALNADRARQAYSRLRV